MWRGFGVSSYLCKRLSWCSGHQRMTENWTPREQVWAWAWSVYEHTWIRTCCSWASCKDPLPLTTLAPHVEPGYVLLPCCLSHRGQWFHFQVELSCQDWNHFSHPVLCSQVSKETFRRRDDPDLLCNPIEMGWNFPQVDHTLHMYWFVNINRARS